MTWKANTTMHSEKVVYHPPSDEKIVRRTSCHVAEKEMYQTPHATEKETITGFPSPIQATREVSYQSPLLNDSKNRRELPSGTGMHQNPYASYKEATATASPEGVPQAPTQSASSVEVRDPMRSRSMSKSSMAFVITFAIIAMILVKLPISVQTALGAECVSSLSPHSFSGPVVAVMGATGTGKSSLIRDLQGRDSKGCLPQIGHTLQSCTKNVTWYSGSLGDRAFTILDTPGFDDIALSDSSTLQNLATELASIHQRERQLAGLIYLHDISKVKMGRTSYKNLQLFQKMVGSQSLKNVMLVTTHWSSGEDKESRKRETELKNSFWQPMIKHGSQVFRHRGTVGSAQTIASYLIHKSPIVPKITDELVRQKLTFGQTEAGKMVNEGLEAFSAEMKDEIRIINGHLKDMTEQRAKDAMKAEMERAKLEKELNSARQEAAKKDEAKKELQALNHRLAEERRERLKEMAELKKEREKYANLLKDTARSQERLKAELKDTTRSQEQLKEELKTRFGQEDAPSGGFWGFLTNVVQLICGFALWMIIIGGLAALCSK